MSEKRRTRIADEVLTGLIPNPYSNFVVYAGSSGSVHHRAVEEGGKVRPRRIDLLNLKKRPTRT